MLAKRALFVLDGSKALGKAVVQRWLKKISESAAASLAEALEETLTLHRLGISGALRKTLSTTNPIESAIEVTGQPGSRGSSA